MGVGGRRGAACAGMGAPTAQREPSGERVGARGEDARLLVDLSMREALAAAFGLAAQHLEQLVLDLAHLVRRERNRDRLAVTLHALEVAELRARPVARVDIA